MNTRSSGRWWLVILIIIIIPILVGVMMSLRFFDWLPTSNDWIGFWGGYAGAVVGGIITLIVMRQTLKNSEDLQHKVRNGNWLIISPLLFLIFVSR